MSNQPNHPGLPGNWMRGNLPLASDPEEKDQPDQQQLQQQHQQQQMQQLQQQHQQLQQQHQLQQYYNELFQQQQVLASQQQQGGSNSARDRDSLLSLLTSNNAGIGGLDATSSLESQQHLASFVPTTTGSTSNDNSLVAALGGSSAPLNYFSTTPGVASIGGSQLSGIYDPSSAFMATSSAGLPSTSTTTGTMFPGFGGPTDPASQQALLFQQMWAGSSSGTQPSMWSNHPLSAYLQPGFTTNLDLPQSYLSPTPLGSRAMHSKSPASGPDGQDTLATASSPMSKLDESLTTKAGGAGRETDRKSRARRTKGKPKRPLSAYNIFFKEERTRILSEIPDKKLREQSSSKKRRGDEDNDEEEDDDDDGSDKGDDDADDDEGEVDGKQKKASGKKRKRVPHGKIGFESLAKVVGQRWKDLEEDRRNHFKQLADLDMKRYREEMEIFMKKQREGLELSRERLESLVDEETKKRYFEGSGKLP